MSKYSMYKKPNKDCPICKGAGTLTVKSNYGDDHNYYYDKIRCDCTKVPTKKYRKILKKLKKYYDNNSEFNQNILITNPYFR